MDYIIYRKLQELRYELATISSGRRAEIPPCITITKLELLLVAELVSRPRPAAKEFMADSLTHYL